MTSTTRKADIESGAWVWNGEESPPNYETGRTRSVLACLLIRFLRRRLDAAVSWSNSPWMSTLRTRDPKAGDAKPYANWGLL
jgi:hypothetical protein